MREYGNMPTDLEKAYTVVGPVVRGDLATTDPRYPMALFLEAVVETATSNPVLVDMAKFSDGSVHLEWLRGGVVFRIKADQKFHFAQRFDSSTSTSAVRVTTSSGHPIDAGEEIELMFDEDLRYLEFAWDSTAGSLTHFARQRPNKRLALADT